MVQPRRALQVWGRAWQPAVGDASDWLFERHPPKNASRQLYGPDSSSVCSSFDRLRICCHTSHLHFSQQAIGQQCDLAGLIPSRKHDCAS